MVGDVAVKGLLERARGLCAEQESRVAELEANYLESFNRASKENWTGTGGGTGGTDSGDFTGDRGDGGTGDTCRWCCYCNQFFDLKSSNLASKENWTYIGGDTGDTGTSYCAGDRVILLMLILLVVFVPMINVDG